MSPVPALVRRGDTLSPGSTYFRASRWMTVKKSLRMYLNMHVLDIAWNGRGQEFSHWA
jgi:hypothetical protein